MSRFAKNGRVFFFEEPVFEDSEPYLRSYLCPETGVSVQTPVLPFHLDAEETRRLQKALLDGLLRTEKIRDYIAWYYTPMAREYSAHLQPAITLYDCMDELTGFAGAPPAMRANEEDLFLNADLVFTGGASLFAAKRKQHHAVYLFPSSVDVGHFSQARQISEEPPDQALIPYPRLGYAGVIDERMDLDLLQFVAEQRRDWQLVLIGPVVKIDELLLPRAPNIHYLGMRQYHELPAYMSGWRVGMLPFAINAATRFISPTKTPEYLAAGLQVVSTAITDVASPYGENGLAAIATDKKEFVSAINAFLSMSKPHEIRDKIDQFLSQSSWDRTWSEMNNLIVKFLKVSELGAHALMQSAREDVAHV